MQNLHIVMVHRRDLLIERETHVLVLPLIQTISKNLYLTFTDEITI